MRSGSTCSTLWGGGSVTLHSGGLNVRVGRTPVIEKYPENIDAKGKISCGYALVEEAKGLLRKRRRY